MKREPKAEAGYWSDTVSEQRQARAAGYSAGYDGRPRSPTAGKHSAAWLEGYDQARRDTNGEALTL